MAKKSNDPWAVTLTVPQLVIVIGVMTGCLAISFYLGFFSGKRVGQIVAMDNALATSPRVPITGDPVHNDGSDKTEAAVSDVYARLKDSPDRAKGDAIVELPMPAIAAIPDAKDEPEKGTSGSLTDTLEAVETPQPKKAEGLSDPWEAAPAAAAHPTATVKKSIDQVLDESSAEHAVSASTVAPTKIVTVLPTVVAKPMATATPKASPTPTMPKPTAAPKETAKPSEGAQIIQGVINKGWYAQVAAPGKKSDADAVAGQLRKNGFRVAIENANVRGEQYFRILVGPEETRPQAEALVQQLQREKYINGVPFIRMLK